MLRLRPHLDSYTKTCVTVLIWRKTALAGSFTKLHEMPCNLVYSCLCGFRRIRNKMRVVVT